MGFREDRNVPQCEEEHHHPWLVLTEEQEEGSAARGKARVGDTEAPFLRLCPPRATAYLDRKQVLPGLLRAGPLAQAHSKCSAGLQQ